MRAKISKKFTKWYVRQGYGVFYDDWGLIDDFYCPFWVRPLLIFFSPSIYVRESCKILDQYMRGGLA